jgi:predicted nucleotidyltransferase
VVKIPEKLKNELPEGLIYLCYRGSQSHGIYLKPDNPNSVDDIDLLGIFIAPIEHYLGFGRTDVYEKWVDEYDMVFYEVRKFIGLLLKNNPNVMSTLWLDEKNILFEDPLFKLLREHRNIFVSKLAYKSYCNYAKNQLTRMTHLNQEKLAEINKRKKDLLDAGCIITDNNELHLPAGASDKLIEFKRQYDELKSKYFKGWMGEKRKQLVEKYGMDVKNGAHCLRLLKQGKEFLETGNIIVDRTNIDAQESIDIKQGKWNLEKIQKEAERLFREVQYIYENKCTLPEIPDRNKAEQLCMQIIYNYYNDSQEFHELSDQIK